MISDTFSDKGFKLFENEIPEDLISQFEAEIRQLFMYYAQENECLDDVLVRLDRDDKPTLYRIYQYIPKMLAYDVFKTFFMKYAKECLPNGLLFDIGSGVLFGLPNDKRLVWDWHQEVHYHAAIENIVHIWIPLFNPGSKKNGAMSALTGSHKLGALPFTVHKPFANGGTSYIPKDIDSLEKKYEEFHFEVPRRGFAIFDKNLIHKSNHNSSGKTRFTCVFRIASLKELPQQTDFTHATNQ